MRYLILLLFPSILFSQNKIQYDHFSNLFGLEDSSGSTHIFYRQYLEIPDQAYYNDIFHFNLKSNTDELFLNSRAFITQSFELDTTISDISFWNGDLDNFIYCGILTGFDPSIFIISPQNNLSDVLGVGYNPVVEITNQNDSIIYISFNGYFQKSETKGNHWDLSPFNFDLLGLSPFNYNFLLGQRDDKLHKSIDGGLTTYLSDSSSSMPRKIYFDLDSNYIYQVAEINNQFVVKVSNNIGELNSWRQTFSSDSEIIIDNDKTKPGYLILAAGKKLYLSHDYGSTFQLIEEFSEMIVGIYRSTFEKDETFVATLHSIYKIKSGIKEKIKSITPVGIDKGKIIKGSFQLHQNYPNPFNPSTTISYEIKETSFIELRIYDALGRFIKLVDEGIKIPGKYTVKFEAENLSTGVYFYQLISGKYTTQNKMLLLK